MRHQTGNINRSTPPLVGMRGIWLVLLLAFSVLAVAQAPPQTDGTPGDQQPRWWKGNLHTHSLWSDGDEYPELVVEWYREHGYNFLALTDHDTLDEGEKWVDPNARPGGMQVFQKYVSRLGADRVEQRRQGGLLQVRLKTWNELRRRYEQPDRFLLLSGEEMSDQVAGSPVHLNVLNAHDPIVPGGGVNAAEVVRGTLGAVREQQNRTGRFMIAQLNHPNFFLCNPNWQPMTAEDIAPVMELRFFEVHNGIPGIFNEGDARHAGTERFWDIILARRLSKFSVVLLYATATDDAHSFQVFTPGGANPGHGWVMVRASHLTPESILRAMNEGDFYASTGVMLRDLRFDGKELRIEIVAEPNKTYTTEFIGTRSGFDPQNRPVLDPNGQPIIATRIYSPALGAVLHQVAGPAASYVFKGDELLPHNI